VERLYWEVLRRAEQALEDARRLHRRSLELQRFVRALHTHEPGELVVCAWCGRLTVEGEWVDLGRWVSSPLRHRLRKLASHGICPDCFDHVTAATEHERRGST
jgi:hypothetical protein